MGLSTTYTKVETDYKLQELQKFIASGIKGTLKTTDTAPTTQGLYVLSDIGTYTNLGGIVTTTGKINYAYFDGTTWKLIATDIPNYVAPINNLTSTSTTDYLSSNMGRILNETKLDKSIFNNNILPIADFPQLKELYITGSGIDLTKDYAITVFRRMDLGNGNIQYTFYLRNITDSTDVFSFDFTTSDLISSINSSSHNYRLGENFYLFRNTSKTSNATIYVYCILDWSSMTSNNNYGSSNILKKSIFNLAYSPTVKSFIDGNYLNKTTNKKVFTNNPELNKYIKELYIYGSGLDPLKTYTVSLLNYADRDTFPLFFRISDNNGLVIATIGGENYDKSLPYSTVGSNYNNSGVYVKYIIDWEAVGRGNNISTTNINYNDNQQIESIITKEAFNIVNSPTINVLSNINSGISPVLANQVSSFSEEFLTEKIESLVDEEILSEDEIITDNNGRILMSVNDDGSVNMPFGLKKIRVRGTSGSLFNLTIDESNGNSLLITKI